MASSHYAESDRFPELLQPGLEVTGIPRRPIGQPSDLQNEAVEKQFTASQPFDEHHAGSYSVKTTRNPFGLSSLLFGILVALVTAIIMGAALGGALGNALHSKNKSTSSPLAATTTLTVTQTLTSASTTTSPTTQLVTNFTAPAPSTIASLNLGASPCPTLNNQPYTSFQGDVFEFTCDVDYYGNDLVAIVAYSLDECCDACSNLNINLAGPNRCSALTFQANMTFAVVHNTPAGGANCYLKNATSSPPTKGGGGITVGAVIR